MRTPRGVLLHWDPPELIPKRLDGYVLEGRQGSQDWEILDQAVAGTEIQLLVPGLIKVCAEREGPPCPLTVSSSQKGQWRAVLALIRFMAPHLSSPGYSL